MKVKELIAILEKTDPERLVVLSRDPEGNGYSKAYCGEEMAYHPDWGEVKYENLTPELKELGYADGDVASEDFIPCFVLWP